MSFAKISGVGSYLPKKVLTNHDLEKTVDTTNEWIVQRTGIEQRHIAEKDELTSDLAYKASLKCLENANLTKDDIDCIIVATATPDLTLPSTATILQKKLGCKGNVRAFDISAVCSGFIYGLYVAESLIKTNKVKRVLLVGSETFSRLLNWEDRTTCVLFGDGAGAFLLEQTEKDPKENNNSGIIDSEVFSDGDFYQELCTSSGVSFQNPEALNYIHMNGQEVYKHAVRNLESVAKHILEKNSIAPEDIDVLVPHQANKRIIDSTAKKLKLDPEKVIVTVNKHANTSAASIPLAFDHALQEGRIKRNDLIVLEAMGGGFTWGASLLRY